MQPAHRFCRRACAFVALIFAIAASGAQADDGPILIDKAIAAIGGEQALSAIGNRKSTGQLIMNGNGAPLTIWQQAPDSIRMVAEFPIGRLDRGANPQGGWEIHPIHGLRQLLGDQLEQTRRDARIDRIVQLKTRFPIARRLADRELENRTLHGLALRDDEGNHETWWFDSETNLPAIIEREIPSQGGPVEISAHLNDWRDVGGVMVAHEIRSGTPTRQVVYRYEQVEHDVEIPAGTFDQPDSDKSGE